MTATVPLTYGLTAVIVTHAELAEQQLELEEPAP